jgi:hypothetical protein
MVIVSSLYATNGEIIWYLDVRAGCIRERLHFHASHQQS